MTAEVTSTRKPWFHANFMAVGGCVEKSLAAPRRHGELFEGSSTSADIQLYNGTSEIAVLKISGSSNRRALMNEPVLSTRKPSENSKLLGGDETLEKVLKGASYI
ncbi:hypothetical protein ARMGADRAFT_1074967 [Armillaria gallica]|uniref:Uncharacterized protein n=1 Tax=Armillaria gallica TaxID=47427 RepID=A0A2H3DVK3_ARMGA|nr:hypothetical protein ARMGADRAFT_1074967 [Armillaria gallica]